MCNHLDTCNIFWRMQISCSWNECHGLETWDQHGSWCCGNKLEEQSANDQHIWRDSAGQIQCTALVYSELVIFFFFLFLKLSSGKNIEFDNWAKQCTPAILLLGRYNIGKWRKRNRGAYSQGYGKSWERGSHYNCSEWCSPFRAFWI